MIKLEPALADQESRLEGIARDVSRLNGAIKAWRKSVAEGVLPQRAKSASQAAELVSKIDAQVNECADSWAFDAKSYLVDSWMDELIEAAAESDLRAFRDEDALVVPPLVLLARPSQESMFLDKERLRIMRQKAVLKELQARLAKGREAANQDFLDSLYRAWDRRPDKASSLLRFREAYETFCLAPGWKKENSRAAFVQQIYALHTSGLSLTRDGTPFNLQEPSSKVAVSDIFEVRAKDGRPIRYYGISFTVTR